MTKDEAVAVLSGIRAAFAYGLVVDQDVSQAQLPGKIRGKLFGFEDSDGELTAIKLDELADMIEDRGSRRIIQDNFRLLLRSALVRTTHELVMLYCGETGQMPKYRAQPWFQFARIWRNVLSHKDGALLHMWPADLTKAGVVTVTWRKRTITTADVGKLVGLSPYEAFKLHDDIAEFLRNDLT